MKKLTSIAVVVLISVLAAMPSGAQQQEDFESFELSADVVSSVQAQIESRVFFNGALNWIFSAGVLGVLSMRGYGETENGGTITSVTGCFYNSSNFSRTFKAEMSVKQGNNTLQQIEFSRSFFPQIFSCHKLLGFDVEVAPGEFEVVIAYSSSSSDNFWLGFGATTDGDMFDVAIGSQRPPFATGAQGPIVIKGVGIKYRIDLNDSAPPPPPPPEPPPLCTPTDTSLCLGENRRFQVTVNFEDFGGNQGAGIARGFDDVDDSGLFWFFGPSNLEVLVKVLNGCPINDRFWVFLAATTDVEFELTVVDLETGSTKSYFNPLGTAAPAVTDTDAFATCP